jgi:transcriptional regulator with XRE-family HTH domain
VSKFREKREEMAVTSGDRDRNAAEVRRLHAAGMSQRQIAQRLNISRPMVQRILETSDPVALNGSDEAELRAEMRRELDAIWAENGGSFVHGNAVDPRVIELEKTEDYMRSIGAADIKSARLARMMAQGELL